jgi:predicted DCC family thiol-disulfide oxidoreductase YuxK
MSLVTMASRPTDRSDQVRRTSPPPDGRAVVLYDGHCRFCTRSAMRLVRLVGADRVHVLSFREPGVVDHFPGLTHERCMAAMQLVEPDGRVWAGGAAAARALARRPVVGKAALVYFVPGARQVADAGYRWAARNRYRLGRRADDCEPDGTCHLH